MRGARTGAQMAVLAAITASAASAWAATYYVDYEGGADTNAGTSAEAAFKHCPGDPGAKDASKAVKLAPGDTVLFKGGVVYAGKLLCASSGSAGKPITYNGNTAGTFGQGPAIIDGADPVTGWRRCASADDAKGNPRWKDIFYADVPKFANWPHANLSDGRKPLPVAQDPNPADPLFQEEPDGYYQAAGPLVLDCPAKVYPEPGTQVNSARPLILTIINTRNTAVVSPVPGAAFTVQPPKPMTVRAVGIAMVPAYTQVKEVAFLGDGNELLRVALEKGKPGLQRFPLPAPTTFGKLTVKLLSTFEPGQASFTAVAKVAAFDESNVNVLEFPSRMTLTDANNLKERPKDYYKGMVFAFHGGPNMVEYLDVEGYDANAHRLDLEFYGGQQYKNTRYAFLNSVRLIDVPGEYSVEAGEGGRTSRLYLLPERLEGDAPAGIRLSRRGEGIGIQGASHVVVEGFVVRQQGGMSTVNGISARGPAEDVVIRDCDVSLVRGGAGITTFQVNGVAVQRCRVHDCPGHTKGIVLRNGKDVSTRDCTLARNTSTALDYYTCDGGTVAGNTVLDHLGMHANGLTFYLGCRNLLIERNRVSGGNVCLTFSEAENLLVRNNLFDGGGRSVAVGIWSGGTIRNCRLVNNALVRSNAAASWATGLFTNNRRIEGLVVENNIIDGLCGDPPFPASAVFRNNLYTRLGPDREKKNFGPGEMFEPDAKKVFVDPAKGDFRLAPGSPAIDAGASVDVNEDIDGAKRPQGKAIDIGPYEAASGR